MTARYIPFDEQVEGEPEARVSARPVGFLVSPDRPVASAISAITEKRYKDADRWIAELPRTTSLDSAWEAMVRGLIASSRSRLSEAEALFFGSTAHAFVAALAVEKDPGVTGWRLAAQALHHAGRVVRRQDRPKDALAIHLASYRLRTRFGSHEECWVTAVELGLDADMAGQNEKALRWHREAIDEADRASQETDRLRAVAWGYLSASLAGAGDYEDAVGAARKSLSFWTKHDSAAAIVARAELKLGEALLSWAASLHDRGDDSAETVLDDAIHHLSAAHEELLSFGPDHAADARWCAEQQSAAESLRSSMGSTA